MQKTGLTASFLRSFTLLIVIPILLILAAAVGIVRKAALEEAVERMTLAQKSVAAALEAEIREAELALAHFLLVNDELAMDLASRYNGSMGAEKTAYGQQLTQLFNVLMLPRSNVIALHFYMRDGAYFGLKDDLALPVETVRRARWYARALASPDHTMVDVSDGPVTYIARSTDIQNRPLLTVAYAPGGGHREGQVEVACLYIRPGSARLIVQHSRADMGVMALVDSEGTVLVDGARGGAQLPEAALAGRVERLTWREEGRTWICFTLPVAARPCASSAWPIKACCWARLRGLSGSSWASRYASFCCLRSLRFGFFGGFCCRWRR